MKKVFWSLTIFIVLNITTAYFFLFTSFGNGFVSEIITKKLNEKDVAKFTIEKFVLTKDSVDFKINMDETSVVEVLGDINIFSQKVNLKYNVDIKDLSKLEKFLEYKLNGTVKLSGTVIGDSKLAVIKGSSNIFDSNTTYTVNLKDFEPDIIKYIIKGAKIDKLLYTVNQPIYAKGLVDITGDITGVKPENLSGKIVTKIYKGNVNTSIVNKNFATTLKKALNFHADVVTELEPYQLVAKAQVSTSMADVFVKKAVLNVKSASITSDYQVIVANLSNLYDVTNTKMRGAFRLDGTVRKTKDLLVTGTSDVFNGKLDFELKNSNLTANVNNIEVKPLTYTLYYPEVFNSKANAKVTYNLVDSSGVVDANLINGNFLPNKFSAILNQFAKFDLTKEVYESVQLDSKINKNIINSTIEMKSKLTQIIVPKSTLDSKKRTIDAIVETKIKSISVNAVVSGSLDSPKIKVDTSKLLKDKAINSVKEKVLKKIENDGAKSLLKGLFN